jgi:AcrR family transcriptional regulator
LAPYHHGNLRAALLELAAERVEETGVAGLSLRDLARGLGVSHAAPRPHFRDKQALLDALAIDGLERLGKELEDDLDLQRKSADFRSRLLAFARTYVRFAAERPALLGLMFARKEHAGAPEVRAAIERAFAAQQALIADALSSEEVVGDPDAVVMALLVRLQGLAAIVAAGMIGSRPVDTVIDGTIDSLLTGLRPPSAAAGAA